MNLVVDRPSDLLDRAFREAMFRMEAFRAHILEEDWNGLPQSSQLELRPHKRAGKICFIPLDTISFSDIRMMLGVFPGVSIQGLMLLAYCQQFSYSLYSYDSTLTAIATMMNVVQFGVLDDQTENKIHAYMKERK